MENFDQIQKEGEPIYHQEYTLYRNLFRNQRFTVFEGSAIRAVRIGYIFSDLTIYFANGEIADWPCKGLSSYQFQFGIAVSADGNYVFVQTWENGLYCLHAKTGQVAWRTESKRGITSIFVNKDTVLCHQREQALQLLDIHTGKVIQEKRPATAWGFTALNHRYIICQITARRWELIDAQTMETVETFLHKDFSNGHTDYCIRDITLTENGSIRVYGWKSMWDYSVSPAVRLPNAEFTHIIPSKVLTNGS